MRAAIYCRVSTSSQKDEKTIQSQLHELPIYAKSQGWEGYPCRTSVACFRKYNYLWRSL